MLTNPNNQITMCQVLPTPVSQSALVKPLPPCDRECLLQPLPHRSVRGGVHRAPDEPATEFRGQDVSPPRPGTVRGQHSLVADNLGNIGEVLVLVWSPDSGGCQFGKY